jgi:hypothetical protein
MGKLLKHKCRKWARMTHLKIWNTSYDQKKGSESNQQFDSQPLKVRNQPNFLTCRWHRHTVKKLLTRATTLLQTSLRSEVYTEHYAPSKSQESELWEFRNSHLGDPGQKKPFGCGFVERRRVYYKGEGGGFPQVRVVVNLVNLVNLRLPVVSCSTKSVQTMH